MKYSYSLTYDLSYCYLSWVVKRNLSEYCHETIVKLCSLTKASSSHEAIFFMILFFSLI